MSEELNDDELLSFLDFNLAKSSGERLRPMAAHEEVLSGRVRRMWPHQQWGEGDETPRGVARNAMKFGGLIDLIQQGCFTS